MGFSSLGLKAPLLETVTSLGYQRPTPIQVQAIPPTLKGRDIMAAAQTGTGKTAAFLLPLLQQLAASGRTQPNKARCLILVPTRELATQVCDSAIAYGNRLNLRVAAVYGGVKINPQMMKMRKGVDILVATPGRLLDLYHNNAIGFQQLRTLVLDEADKMLNLGFAEELQAILALLPQNRQTLMFSATFSPEVRKLASGMSANPVEINTTPANTAATTVKQWLCPVDKKKKTALLTALLRRNNWRQVLVFSKTKKGADQLCRHLLTEGIPAVALHGDRSQAARARALADFKEGAADILVATDIAARGLDIDGLPQVINFDLPVVAADYVHRIGRTGRAGMAGEAVSLVCADEFEQLNAIEQLLRKSIPREEIEGYEPKHNLPPSRPIVGPRKPKKPKKPKTSAAGTGAGNKPGAPNSTPSGKAPQGRQKRAGSGEKQAFQNRGKRGTSSRDSKRGNRPGKPGSTGSRVR